MNSNVAFLLVCLGVLLVYSEFVFIGRIFPGVIGVCLVLAGAARVMQFPIRPYAAGLLVLSVLLLLVEAYRPVYGMLLLTAAILMTIGVVELVRTDPIRLWLALPASVLLSFATCALLTLGRFARQNKSVGKKKRPFVMPLPLAIIASLVEPKPHAK